jgi:hypothetical protein
MLKLMVSKRFALNVCYDSNGPLGRLECSLGLLARAPRAELMAQAGEFLLNEHGPRRAGNLEAIEGLRSTTSGTRGQRA